MRKRNAHFVVEREKSGEGGVCVMRKNLVKNCKGINRSKGNTVYSFGKSAARKFSQVTPRSVSELRSKADWNSLKAKMGLARLCLNQELSKLHADYKSRQTDFERKKQDYQCSNYTRLTP